jgi:hypothetical protein
MQDHSQLSTDAEPSAATTAHHMADAVGYLMRVAAEAGLQTIAIKLAHVRANLLTLASAQSEASDAGDDAGSDERIAQGDSYERRKPH